ncbi:hypothetical protein BN7_2155 [Wickerhamomyces ciferrii]|uniref:Retrograde transport protein Dsl1 C-terminal domain-containing protein n=1 Tax=Wickerhamomyces ciferrii (strain ATCC 14091 / BCRC 22168 / CBS 111 / JCM 3599 / NBRC 0793 / NRRL Y-1031 F-60-10) TaxID=1206466 RepID=K0KHW4_WICCF|nr:uncharacterized protein BN7_2155 [Wickerhamomyces ciferrii]CCH42611.1 hypothetical protein BN7_2155 [Wickerhamomyces ciferrii]
MNGDSDIDAQLESLNEKIHQLVDPEVLNSQLNGSKTLDFNTISKLQQRDYEITQELQQLREFWIVSTLLKETEVNLDLFEFENVLYSLKNFEKKIKSDSFDTKLIILEKLQAEHDRLYNLTIENIGTSWSKLIEVQESSVTFNAEVDINGNTVLYESVSDVIKSNDLQLKVPNSNIIHLVDQKLLTPLTKGSSLELTDNKIIINPIAENIEDQIKSISNLANFISFIPEDQQITNYISPRLFEWLKEVITNNIDLIYSNKQLQQEFLKLGQFLSERSFKRNDLQNWINNELNEIAVEKYVDQHIEKIRELVRNLDKSVLQNLVVRELTASPHELEQKPNITHQDPVKKSAPEPKITEDINDDEEDGWGWDDEEIEFDEPLKESTDLKAETETETKDDDFNDDWDWNDDEETEEVQEKLKPKPKPKSKLVSKLSKKNQIHSNESSRQSTPGPSTPGPVSTYKTTTLPDKLHAIIESYLSTKSKLPSQYHDLHFSKLNYLITAYYILVPQEFQNNSSLKLLLYNDLEYLSQLNKIPRLFELKEQYLYNFIKTLKNDIDEHFAHLNGLDPGISASKTYKIIDDIQLVITMGLRSLDILPIIKSTEIIIKLANDLYQKVISSVYDKGDIGEDESEYLNVIIQKFLTLKFNVDYSKIPNHSKLGHVGFIVNSHLKDILDSFYDAEFFDLSTLELIALIDKLFADSDLKRKTIDEIRAVREAE